MTGIRKPCGSIEEDLVNVATRKDGSKARCVPLGKGAMVLPVCKGEQHKAEGYEHSLAEEDAKAQENLKREAEE